MDKQSILKKSSITNAPIPTDQGLLFKENEQFAAAADFFQSQFSNRQVTNRATRNMVKDNVKRLSRICRYGTFLKGNKNPTQLVNKRPISLPLKLGNRIICINKYSAIVDV